MLARADLQAIQGLPAASAGPFPGWARAVNAPETQAEAAFLAGAALARLDAIVRENPPWAGVFRQRLALAAAAASVARAGRTEDEAALRDAFHLTPARRRSRTGGQGAAGLAGARRPPDPAVAVLVRRRRRGSGDSSRRSAAGGARGRRGLRRQRPACAVCRGPSFRPRRARLGGRPSPGAGEGRASRSRPGSPTPCSLNG